MADEIPNPLVVLVMMDENLDLNTIKAVAPGKIELHHEQPAAFEDEAGMFPAATGLKSFREPWSTQLSPAERDTLLQRAHVLVNSLPYPLHLRDRMPNLRWAEFTFAGVSDYTHIDFWNTRVRITSGRGVVQALPIAEMVVAATLIFAKGLGTAQRQTESGALDGSQFQNKLIAGKTMGVVGLGGLGGETARLAKAMGMRVVATRHSARSRQDNVDGVDVLYPAADLHAMLAECDFVAACMPLTPETERVFDATAFGAMKDGAFFANVARGEVVDESALKDALRSGKLGGAYLDVYSEERQRPPDPELMAFPNVVMTPHNSGETDVSFWPVVESFSENLRRFIAGEPLINEVDFSRGY
jgi:phosphoglycerate dehydrogenase-like enzyme